MEQSKTQSNHIITNPNERQFTLDEYRALILDASVIQQKDIALKQTAEKLEHIIEAEKARLSQQDAGFKITKSKLTIEDLYTTAKELEISREYIDKILKNYNLTKEEMQQDLEKNGVVYSESTIDDVIKKRIEKRLCDADKIIDVYEGEIRKCLKEELPLDEFEFFKNRCKHVSTSLLYRTQLYSTTKVLEVFKIEKIKSKKWFFEKAKEKIKKEIYAYLFFGVEPSFLGVTRYAQLGERGKSGKKLYLFQTIQVYNPSFLRAANKTLGELKERFKAFRTSELGYQIIAEYNAE